MESRGTSKYKFKPLTGHTALAVNGVPAEFAAQCMFILNKYQISAAWRVADHSEPERPSTEKKRLTIDIASYPKPSDVKEKSSNWGFTQWFIADDPLLGKYDDESKPVNVGVKRSARVEPTQHFVSLRFILSGLSKNPPTMRLDDITDSNELIITCLDAPAGAPSVHRIQLNRGARPATVDAASLQVLPDSARSKPEWWPAKYHFADLLDQRFPVEYMPTNDKEFQPVRVLGIRDTATQEIIPIITDMDLLWVTEPGEDNPMIQQCNERDVPVFTVMNCYRESEKAQLLDAIKKLIAIDNELYNDDPEMLDNLDLTLVTDDVFSRMGCITPFTAYCLLLTNQRFGLFAEHLEDLMQHGP